MLAASAAIAQGPITIMGIDAEDGGIGGHGGLTPYRDVAASMLSQVTNGGTGILVIGGQPGSQVQTKWNALGVALGGVPVSYAVGAGAINLANFNAFKMVLVASDRLNTFGGLTEEENTALGGRSGSIAAFVNGGGALLAFSSFRTNPYPYLGGIGSFTFAFPAQFSNITATGDGLAVGITNSNLDVCCWHNEIVSAPPFMKVLATNASTGRPCAVGGRSVVIVTNAPHCELLPSNSITIQLGQTASFTLKGTDPDVGDTVTLSATSALPAGMTSSPALPVSGPAGGVTSTFTWTPTLAQVGTHNMFFQARDQTGRIDTCGMTITVLPNAAPTITCPAAATLECTAPGGNNITLSVTVADANGDNVIVTWKVDNVLVRTQTIVGGNGTDSLTHHYSLGQHTVDVCANDQRAAPVCCGTTVKVQDTTVPVITCAPDEEQPTDPGTCTWTGTPHSPQASDNCGIASITANLSFPYAFPHGTTEVIWTVRDHGNNTATCSQFVTVVDREPPTITCPRDVTVSTDPGVCTASGVVLGTPTTGDNCGIASVTNNAPAVFNLGMTTVTWTVTDRSGNRASCDQFVYVLDQEPPTLVCPPDVTVPTDPNTCTASNVPLGTPTVSDNCAIEPGSLNNNAPAVFQHGSTLVEWSVQDTSGNITVCQQTVTVVDNQAPVVTCKLNTAMLWPPSHDLANVSVTVTVTDNCPPPAGGFVTGITVIADEDDETPTGDGTHSPDAKDTNSVQSGHNTPAVATVRLRAERKGDLDGRVYVLVLTTNDAHGNLGKCVCTVLVPHSQSKAAIASVMAQASAAQAQAAAFVAAIVASNFSSLPAPYVKVGDGAVIGPKQ